MNKIHAQATALGLAFEAKGIQLSRSEKLETIARIQGFKDFNTALAAQDNPPQDQTEALKVALRDLVLNTISRGRKPVDDSLIPQIGRDVPGHSHRVPGVWDADNGPLAGKECQWCKSWNTALSLISEQDGAF